MRTLHSPLAGKRIVVTRTPEQSSVLLRDLKSTGAEPIVLPCVEFRPPEDCASLDAQLARIADFDFVVLTSPNAAKFFCDALRRVSRSPKELSGMQVEVAAIGATTHLVATLEGINGTLAAPDVRSGREFVQEFAPSASGKKIFLPQSDQAPPYIADELRKAGAKVTSVVAYRTCMPESVDSEQLDRIRREGADVFVFASPSAFRNFAATFGGADLKRFAEESVFAAIGPTTAQAIREANVPVEIEAVQPSSQGIIDAMIEYFGKQKQEKVRR